MQNLDGRLILTAEVANLIEINKKAKITEVYFLKGLARYLGLQYKPFSGAEREKRYPCVGVTV